MLPESPIVWKISLASVTVRHSLSSRGYKHHQCSSIYAYKNQPLLTETNKGILRGICRVIRDGVRVAVKVTLLTVSIGGVGKDKRDRPRIRWTEFELGRGNESFILRVLYFTLFYQTP